MSIKKVGGIRFVRIGRVRISFCVARPAPALTGGGELCCTLLCSAFALYGLGQAFARLVQL